MVKSIKNEKFGGERPLFQIHNTRLENIEITDGESGIKCCSDLEADGCKFYGKYPWWHVDRSVITNCYFAAGSRSAIWYSNDMRMENCVIDGPKFFREMKNLNLKDVTINDADETFWKIDGLTVNNVTLHDGTYPFMFCTNVKVDGLVSDSKYVFQYVKDAEIRNAKITTKDALWETENVTVYDSELNGEFLGWHSKNLRLVNCHITGEQPLCYAEGLVLENCTFGSDCDRMFEDSTVNADIRGKVINIKNPISGKITADNIGSITLDEHIKQPADCKIVIRKQQCECA